MDTTLPPTTVDVVEPDPLARNIRTGSRIWAASEAFFFLAFFFAFLYLRALNTNGLWRGWPHHHPSPSLAFGIAILLCVVGSAAIARGAVLVAPEMWRVAMWAALALALAAVGLQSAQFSSLGFGRSVRRSSRRNRWDVPARGCSEGGVARLHHFDEAADHVTAAPDRPLRHVCRRTRR